MAAAAPNDVIRVASGTYHEDVVIGKSLSLLGESPENTIIDATGLLNGVNVDGFNHPGLAHVIVSGFTVRNANAQGIVVTNASDVTISNNHVIGQRPEPRSGRPACARRCRPTSRPGRRSTAARPST